MSKNRRLRLRVLLSFLVLGRLCLDSRARAHAAKPSFLPRNRALMSLSNTKTNRFLASSGGPICPYLDRIWAVSGKCLGEVRWETLFHLATT